MILKTRALIAILILLLFSQTSTARAEKFLLADEKDKNIKTLLTELLPLAETQLEVHGADVAQVFHQKIYKAQEKSFDTYENFVWWVKRGEAEEITNFVKDFSPGIEVKKVKAFIIRPGKFDGAAVLDAEVEKLDGKRIHLQKGGKRRISNLVVGFDTAQPGDLICISIHTVENGPLIWEPWLIAQNEPVARAELRVKCDWRLAFSVFGYRLAKGRMQQEILDRDDDHIKDLRIWVDSQQPIVQEPYCPPSFQQTPVFVVARRASRFDFHGNNLWWYYNHWNQVAGDMALYENHYLDETEEVDRLVADLKIPGDDAATASVLWRYVQDEMSDLGTGAYVENDELPSVDEVLELGSGSLDDKAYLFLAMLRSAGLEARLVWAHDSHKGGFLDKYPTWQQVLEPLVKVTLSKGQEVWFDLDCGNCPFGEIRPSMRHTRAIVYDSTCDKANDDLLEKAFVEGTHYGKNPFHIYMNDIKRVDWHKIIFTPGNPSEISGWQRETLTLGLDNDDEPAAALTLESWGLTELSKTADREGSVVSGAQEVAGRRFDQIPSDVDVTLDNSSPDTVVVSMEVSGFELPDPMGNTWILPPELVFGEPTMEAWPRVRRSRFHVARTQKMEWVVRVPLPEGWTGIEMPEEQIWGIDKLQYKLAYSLRGRHLVINRTLIQQVTDVEDVDLLQYIGEEMESIRVAEGSPLVLKKLDLQP